MELFFAVGNGSHDRPERRFVRAGEAAPRRFGLRLHGKGDGLVIEAAGRIAPFVGGLRRRSPVLPAHGPRRQAEGSERAAGPAGG